MSVTKSIIEELKKAIQEKREVETKAFEALLHKNFSESVKEATFYSLPMNNILNIVKKVDFSSISKNTLETLFANTSRNHPHESALLLHAIDIDEESLFTMNDIINILTQLKTCPLCVLLGQKSEEENLKPEIDYEHEIKQLKEEITKLKAEKPKETKNRR